MKTLSTSLVILGALLVSGAALADTFTTRVDAQKQGVLKGGGPDNAIGCDGFELPVLAPRDAATGQVSGKRRWDPIKVTKHVDRTSPNLVQSLATNELLKEVKLRASRPRPTGLSPTYYTVTLTNAVVASLRQYKTDPANAGLPLLEDVTFTFQKIQIASDEGGTTVTDDTSSR